MTGIDPYSYTRGADSISATEQNGSRQVSGSMTSIAPYSNPRRGGFHIRPHYAVSRMWGRRPRRPAIHSTPKNIKEHP